MKRWGVFLVVLCLVFLTFGVSNADTLTIGGDHDSGDQLKVVASDNGTLRAYLWQKNPYSETYSFLQQYCGSFYSYLFLDYGTDSQEKYDNTSFQTISNDKTDNDTIQTILALGDTGVQLTQKISYETGQLYYRKEWQITNNGDNTYSNLHFLHGGDTYFAYDDKSEGHWDNMLRMVYLTNSNMGVSGIMGMYGALSSPADHYFAGWLVDYYSVRSSGQLPDTVLADYKDAAYSLQWNRDSLAPGETWTIVAFEKWTEAGFVQVMAGADQTVSADVTIDYDFTIQNLQDSPDTFDLEAVSSNGWTATVDPSVVNVDVSSSKAVTVRLVIPADAVPWTTDALTLTAVSRSDGSVSNSDSVTTTVNSAINKYSLSLNVTGDGTVTASPDLGAYPYGTEVTLTATPASDYWFKGWSGDVSGTSSPLSFTMDGDKTVNAEFELLPRISMSTPSNEKGEDQGSFIANVNLDRASSRSVSINYNTVSGTAVSGDDFVGTSGTITWDPGERYKSLYIDIVNDKILEEDETFSLVFSNPVNALFSGSMTKTFTINDNDQSLAVSYTGNGKGTVDLDPEGGVYDNGTPVSLTAHPVTSCDFAGWGGDLSGNALSADITMDSDKSVEAGFSLKTFDITTTAGENGSITGTATAIEYGQDATFQIQANEQYHIASVKKDGSDITPAEETKTFEVIFSEVTDGGHTLDATFAIDHYTIGTDTGTHGSITPVSADVEYGGNQSFQITPDAGYVIEALLVDESPVEMKRTYDFINVQANHTISATFTIDEDMTQEAGLSDFGVTSLDEEPDYAGVLDLPADIDPASMLALDESDVDTMNVQAMTSGDVQPLLDGKEEGETFIQGTRLDIAYTEGEYTGVLPLQMTLEVSKDLLGEDHCAVIDRDAAERNLREAFLEHVEILLVQSPDLYDLLEEAWEELPEEEAKQFFAVTSDDNNYYVDLNLLVADNSCDTPEQTVQPISDGGSNWFFIFDGEKDGHFNVDLAVAAKPLEYTIDFTVGANGKVTSGDLELLSGDHELVLAYKINISFDIVPDDHYHIGALSVDQTGIDEAAGETAYTYSFERVSRDHEVEVAFEIDHFTLTALDCENGAITPISADVAWGDSSEFTISPDEHYYVTEVTVDGEPVDWDTENSTYMFTNVSADHTISADFAIDEYSLTINITGDGSVTASPDMDTYPHSSDVKLTAVPETSMDFYIWGRDLTGSTNPVTLTMDGAKTVTAEFRVRTFDITLTPGSHGDITGDTTVNWGTDHTYTITPDTGYEIVDVTLDGISRGACTSLTINNIITTHTIGATFRIDTHVIEESGLEEFTVTPVSQDQVQELAESIDLPGEMTPESLDVVSEDLVITVSMEGVVSGDVNPAIESRDADEEILDGVSFDIIYSSDVVEIGLLPLEINMEISRDELGEEFCELIDIQSEDEGLASSFLDHVGILKIVSPDTYDLLEVAWDRYPEAEAKGFFEVSSDIGNYYVGFDLLIADAKADSSDLAVQAVADSPDHYFFVFDGKKDGHFTDPVVAVKKPFDDGSGRRGGSGGCYIGGLPALTALLLMPLLWLMKK